MELVFWPKLHSADDHIKLSPLHDHNAYNGLSSSLKHHSHNGLFVMCRFLRFAFVGIESRQARHMKFLILFGTHKSQMLCQNFLSSTYVASDPSSSTSCFKNRYTDLQYCPLCVHGQNSMSSAGCLDNEIFLMSSASLGTNRP